MAWGQMKVEGLHVTAQIKVSQYLNRQQWRRVESPLARSTSQTQNNLSNSRITVILRVAIWFLQNNVIWHIELIFFILFTFTVLFKLNL